MSRLARSWRRLRPWDRVRLFVSLGIFVVVLGGLAVLQLHNHFSRAPVGAPCTRDGDCRSRRCLTVSDYQPTDVWSGSGVLTPEQAAEWNESWNDTFDPLSPKQDGLRPVGVETRYCTRPCESHGDCPGDMACGETLGFAPGVFSDEEDIWVSGKGEPGLFCVHR